METMVLGMSYFACYPIYGLLFLNAQLTPLYLPSIWNNRLNDLKSLILILTRSIVAILATSLSLSKPY